jgi:hypothetical protein
MINSSIGHIQFLFLDLQFKLTCLEIKLYLLSIIHQLVERYCLVFILAVLLKFRFQISYLSIFLPVDAMEQSYLFKVAHSWYLIIEYS